MAGQSIIREKDIAEAFARIEDELLRSMIANLEKHQVDEIAEGINWEQWQAVQLAEVERYVRENALRYGSEFDQLNERMEQLISEAYEAGYHSQEAAILDAISRGFDAERDSVLGLPAARLNALIAATHEDMMQAEYATLRRAEDIYKQVVFNAQVYATSGAGTYAQAIDMATHDFLLKGIDGIVYKNGSRHTIREYSQMAVRTATKRAALQAEGDARDSYGVHTIFVAYRVDACPECMEWVGQVLIDDVYSSGTAAEAEAGGYALLSDAMAQGLFHPNCRDTAVTYFEGINEPPQPFTTDEMDEAIEHEQLEQELSNAETHEREWGRVADMSLDPENAAQARARAEAWGERVEAVERALDGVESGAIRGVSSDALYRMEQHAERYYAEILKRDRERVISQLAKAARMSIEETSVAFNHLFVRQHNLEGTLKKFDPDYEIAQSIQRLLQGDAVFEHDLLLLQHEYLEARLMETGIVYEQAHAEANKVYNYQKALLDWLKEQK